MGRRLISAEILLPHHCCLYFQFTPAPRHFLKFGFSIRIIGSAASRSHASANVRYSFDFASDITATALAAKANSGMVFSSKNRADRQGTASAALRSRRSI
jgi:hypothetical protein